MDYGCNCTLTLCYRLGQILYYCTLIAPLQIGQQLTVLYSYGLANSTYHNYIARAITGHTHTSKSTVEYCLNCTQKCVNKISNSTVIIYGYNMKYWYWYISHWAMHAIQSKICNTLTYTLNHIAVVVLSVEGQLKSSRSPILEYTLSCTSIEGTIILPGMTTTFIIIIYVYSIYIFSSYIQYSGKLWQGF